MTLEYLHFTTRGKSKFSRGLGNSKCETALDGKYSETAILGAMWNGAVADACLRSSYTDIYMASQRSQREESGPSFSQLDPYRTRPAQQRHAARTT